MNILKRSIPLFVTVILIAFSFPFSASAVTDDSIQDTYVNILPAASYVISDGSDIFTSSNSVVYLTEKTYAKISWQADVYDKKFNEYYITIQMTGKPQSVYVSLNPSHRTQAVFSGSHGDLYQYSFTSYHSNISEMYVEVFMGRSYTGNFNILSFIAMRDYSFQVESASYRFRYGLFNDSGYDLIIHSSGSASIPNNFWYSMADPNDNLFCGELFLWFDAGSLSMNYADSVSILIQSICPLDQGTFSIVDSGYSTVAVLETNIISTSTGTVAVGDIVKPLYAYQVTADLSGYALTSGQKIQFYGNVDAGFYRNLNTKAVQFNVVSVGFSYPVEATPWYQVMYNWLAGSMNYNNAQLLTAIYGISSGDDYETMQDIQDINSSVANKQNQANAINDKMNSVSKPNPSDVTTGTPDISGILSGSSAPLVMSTITGGGNGIIVTVLLLVFTFALVGFIFFGKR